MMKQNMICTHSYKVQKEARNTKVLVHASIRIIPQLMETFHQEFLPSGFPLVVLHQQILSACDACSKALVQFE